MDDLTGKISELLQNPAIASLLSQFGAPQEIRRKRSHRAPCPRNRPPRRNRPHRETRLQVWD